MRKQNRSFFGNNSTRVRLAGALGVGVLLLTACSGSPAPANPADGSSEELGSLRVVESHQYDLVQAGGDVADHLELWEPTLSVEFITSQAIAQALSTGDADIGITNPNRFFGAILQGLDATIVGPTIDAWDQYIIAAKRLGATKVEDLKGKKLGISAFGSAGHYSTVKVAERLGWSEDDYEIVTLGTLDGIIAGLQSGTIDGFMWSAFPAFTLEKDGYADVLGSVRDYVTDNPLIVIGVMNEVIEKRPEAVRAFCKGFYEANTMLQDDLELAEQIFIKDWGLDAEVGRKVLEQEVPLLSTDGTLTDENLSNMVATAKATIEGAEDLDLEQAKSMYKNCGDI